MFKFTVLVFAAIFALAAARPSHVVSSPVVLSPHYVQPVVKAHYPVPLVKTVVSPVVHAPVVHTVATPLVHAGPVVPAAAPLVHASPLVQSSSFYHSYGSVVKSYAPAYGIWKN